MKLDKELGGGELDERLGLERIDWKNGGKMEPGAVVVVKLEEDGKIFGGGFSV